MSSAEGSSGLVSVLKVVSIVLIVICIFGTLINNYDVENWIPFQIGYNITSATESECCFFPIVCK